MGGVGAAALLAGCSPAAPLASAAPSAAAASPSMAMSGTSMPGGTTGTASAKTPSPADFAVAPPFHPRRSEPIDFRLVSRDGPAETIQVAPDRAYASMNFDGQVPAPTLRVTEGDTVRFTLRNEGQMAHSIDFHAAQTPWSKNYQPVGPGKSFTFEWTAHHAGVFLYHCGVAPVIMHIGDGMFGAVIVDPAEGRPPAREYVLLQSEFYGSGHDVEAMLNKTPDVVAFNGQAFRHKTAPLAAKVGETVRLFVVCAGPNSTSAFHVIGALFDAYEPSGSPKDRMAMHQTVMVPPGDGALVELTFSEPGDYPFVTHRFTDAEKGAMGIFHVTE